ncbi:MAG: hypothetical protein U0359_11475 [Byssovorax sp.]
MISIAPILSTAHFSAAEVGEILGEAGHPRRSLLFSALRAESDARFLEAAAALFDTIDWSTVPSADYGHHPAVALIGSAMHESGTDHLSGADLVRFCKLADKADAAFALDVIRAIELDDAEAGARVAERVAQKIVAPSEGGMLTAPDDAIGALRTARLLRRFAGADDAAQLRTAVERGFGYGAYPAFIAASIAEKAGLTLPEDVTSLQDSRRLACRLMTWVACALDPALGQEILELAVAKDWHSGDIEAFDLPWTKQVEVVKAGKVSLTRLLGATVLKASGPLDTFQGPQPKKRAAFRISSKRHPNEQKAAKDFDKAAADTGEPFAPAQADLDARLNQCAAMDSGRERVAELLRRGASPGGFVEPNRKETTLHRATSSADCADIVRRLLAAGADVKAVDGNGYGVLDALGGRSREDARAADRLVKAGARCHKNRLFDMAEYGYHRMVAPLIAGGADPRESRNGKTPIEVALEKRHARTAKALGHQP